MVDHQQEILPSRTLEERHPQQRPVGQIQAGLQAIGLGLQGRLLLVQGEDLERGVRSGGRDGLLPGIPVPYQAQAQGIVMGEQAVYCRFKPASLDLWGQFKQHGHIEVVRLAPPLSKEAPLDGRQRECARHKPLLGLGLRCRVGHRC